MDDDPGQISAFAAYNANKGKRQKPKKKLASPTLTTIVKPKTKTERKKKVAVTVAKALNLTPELEAVKNGDNIVHLSGAEIKKKETKKKKQIVRKNIRSAVPKETLHSPESKVKKIKRGKKNTIVSEDATNTNSLSKKEVPKSPTNNSNGIVNENGEINKDIPLKKLKAKNETITKKSKQNKRKNNTSQIQSSEAGSSVTATLNSGSLENQKSLQTNKIKQEKNTSISLLNLSTNSIKEGKAEFKKIVDPISVENFLENFWEKSHCLIQRNDSKYFSDLLSFETVDKMFLKNHIEFTKNIDITSYENGVRKTLNPEGRAISPVVWDFYANGCSIRLLNPQTFIPSVYAMNVKLQEYFHCMVGANVYITPPNSQGFAPHYDDIEAFVIQIEGQKRWKLYKPRYCDEELPRVSSKNFTQDDIGKPILDKVLKPGDVLYFPRGVIHQACTQPGFHSMHITLSVYQKHSYADLLEILIPQMLSDTIGTDVELRKGLPLNIWQNLGVVNLDQKSNERKNIVEKCTNLISRVFDKLKDNIDDAVDQMAKRFQHDALPPAVKDYEMKHTVFGSCSTVDESGNIQNNYLIHMNSRLRLLRANIIRLVRENEKICIYYYGDNSREYHEYEPNFIEIEENDALAVEQLIKSYPCYLTVKQLEVAEDRKIDIAQSLWDRGLLMLENALL